MAVQAGKKFSLWQQPRENECLLDQVKRLTRELQGLQSELFRELSEKDGMFGSQSNPYNATVDLSALKTAADDIRRVLWLCLESASASEQPAESTRDHEQPPRQTYQAGRWLTQQTEPEATIVEPGSFFERLNLVIEGYMQNRGISPGHKRRMKS